MIIKKITPKDNSANQKNANTGTTGINETYKKMLEDKSETLNSTSNKYWKSRGFDKRPENRKE